MPSKRRTQWLLLATAAAAVLTVTGCTAWRLVEARSLAKASEPFQQLPAAPAVRMLVVGDSTGVGTGASQPAFSLAGLLGAAHPGLLIHNRAVDGAKFQDVPGQLGARAGDAQQGYDVILISAGGNDVIRGTEDAALAEAVDRSFAAARDRLAPGGALIVQPPGYVGHAPFFLPPISSWMNSRAARLHAVVRAAADRYGVRYVDLARPKAEDPFVQRPELHASDGLHPSDAGYRVWRDELLAQTDLPDRLARAK